MKSKRTRSLLTLAIGASITNSTNGQFYAKTDTGHFYSSNLVEAALRESARDARVENSEFRKVSEDIIAEMKQNAYDEEYEIWKERGSMYLSDGITPIPENIDVGESLDDLRSEKGFADPLYKRIHFDIMLQDKTSDFVSDALQYVALETVSSGYILISGIGNSYNGLRRRNEFKQLFDASPNKIIRVVCESCIGSHQEVFYKRLSSAPDDMLEIIESDWRTTNNLFGTDFKIYSSYKDAIEGTNEWVHCSGFNEQNHGFPGTCGPAGQVLDQWVDFATRSGQPDVSIYVENPNAPADAYELTFWEQEWETELENNPEQAKKRGLCWHVPYRDSRRACWRACEYGENSDNLGALKLCLSLRQLGQKWKSMKFAEESEVEDGLEEGSKIKPTHALGSDDGLSNFATY